MDTTLGQGQGSADFLVLVSPPARTERHTMMCGGTIGVASGSRLGYVLALLRYAMSTSLKSVEELQLVTGSPVLGRIAYDGEVSEKPLILHQKHQAPQSEAFRQLRTNLQFRDKGRSHRIVMVGCPQR